MTPATTHSSAPRRHPHARAAALLGLTMLLALPASAVTPSDLMGAWTCISTTVGYEGHTQPVPISGKLDIASGSSSNQLSLTWAMDMSSYPPSTCASTFTATAAGATLSHCTLSDYNARFNGVYVYDSAAGQWRLNMRLDWIDPQSTDQPMACTKLKTGS